MRLLAFLSGLLFVTACSQAPVIIPVFHEEGNPPRLADWGQMAIVGGRLRLTANATPYDLATPLFSDYAHKLRTVWMPQGTSATYREGEAFDFPVGTVITKTFYYPLASGGAPGEVLKDDAFKQISTPALQDHALSLANIRLIETRILARRKDGWVALPYVWNDEQTQAVLKRTGDIKRLTLISDEARQDFAYIVPNANQCAGCHATNNTTRAIVPIGLKPRHLNREYRYQTGSQNQLAYWQKAGLLTGVPPRTVLPKNATWTDGTQSLEARARAYLDINCSHCHNKAGAADTSGLHLEPGTPVGPNLGICKLPVAAGSGTGNRRFDINPGAPEDSIFIYRMASTDPGAMMPELGRSVAHKEGVALVAEWIVSLQGGCGEAG